MKIQHTPLVIGNWKMSPDTITLAIKLFTDIKNGIRGIKGVDAVIASPFPYIADLHKCASGSMVKIGAQDVCAKTRGTYTGEVSLSMLKSVGTTLILVGHSERRALGETDELVSEKLITVLSGGLTAVLCVGEKVRDTHGEYFTFIEEQLKHAFSGVKKSHLKNLVIAYEPIWAISKGDGKGNTATPEDAHEMKLFIERTLVDRFGRTASAKVRIIYGGSVNSKNITSFVELNELDGYLPGGASLRASDFVEMVKTVAGHVKK